jgi:nucleoside-diphosphate-sugar epimerase
MGCRTIFAAGTCWEYAGLSAAVSEHQQGWNTNMFAAFKSGLQTMGQSLFRRHGSRFIWGRLFFVYGPGQRMSSLIPSCYRSFAIEGASPNIANPLALNDFIHVADVGAAIRALIEGDGDGGIYNIGTGEPVAVWQVVNMVAEMMGASRAYRDLSPPSDGFWADIAKMRALGWQPELSIRDGIARTLESMAKVRK